MKYIRRDFEAEVFTGRVIITICLSTNQQRQSTDGCSVNQFS